ncbi:MAG: N-formylglutamate amidohydrolase, partial [Gammaproteobacteria bacterium]|nr:N-formylglutamate amidohydrolase [Gammaproteobacteria bacterium]
EYTRALAPADKQRVLDQYYVPYRTAVEEALRAALAEGDAVLHVASHSFTPVLDGTTRDADVGLLFDPARPAEAAWAGRWRRSLARFLPGWKIRRNYPYRGTADGLTTSLRRLFPDPRYAGIELEINQRRALGTGWQAHVERLAASLEAAMSAP